VSRSHTSNDDRLAIRRVLTLCERALYEHDLRALRMVSGSMWTYAEIQRHIRAARRLGLLKPRRPARLQGKKGGRRA